MDIRVVATNLVYALGGKTSDANIALVVSKIQLCIDAALMKSGKTAIPRFDLGSKVRVKSDEIGSFTIDAQSKLDRGRVGVVKPSRGHADTFVHFPKEGRRIAFSMFLSPEWLEAAGQP